MLKAPTGKSETEKYTRRVGLDTKWRENLWRRDFIELLGRRLGFQRVEKMLDVGCGGGLWGRLLSRALPAGVLVAGIDQAQAFVELSVASAKEAGLSDFDYKTGSAEALPYDDDSFDLVTCQTLLMHVKDPVPVLREMKRVLKPGGILLLAEPNNLLGFFSFLQSRPQPAADVIQSQMDFYAACIRGKEALGWGDATIGDRLPAMIAALGFTGISIAKNERCCAFIPPYATEEEQLEIDFLRRFENDGAWIGYGDRKDTLQYYMAGGGDEALFSRLWNQGMAYQKEMFAAIEARTFTGSSGAAIYITAGSKPGA